MNREEIIGKINGFFVSEFEADESTILPLENMTKTLGLDSLDFVDLVVSIENNFGFKVNPEDFQSIVTFQDFYEYVIQNIKQASSQ
ncbi:MAG: acyl carrier protein [Bacteroidetes bacterium]|jgi:acyl carrier protein|nr:acyl carrier protein [Bacteroidota bacterium]MBP7256294.1 acyl carrier protein [Chitinophagales bacterium]MBK7138599.1 acyl carrier protein [Bacteroidota bacterium]MBK7503913.1 acyl carrier protein [Bacteroidota bacterium]MBK8674017.1 acyl carrier protein [Bacteroidota bacterium]